MTRTELDKKKIRPSEQLIIIHDDLDFSWTRREMFAAQRMWNEGFSIFDMSEAFERPIDEVFMLLHYLARKGRIGERTGGIYGKNSQKKEGGSKS